MTKCHRKASCAGGRLQPEQLLAPLVLAAQLLADSRLEGGVNRAKLKFTNINTTTSRVRVRNINESAREGAKQIASE